MHAVAINGSSQENGSTRTLLDHVLKPLHASGWTTEVIHLGGLQLYSCGGCTKCFRRFDGLCSAGADAFNEIFSKMLNSNAIILGSPAGIGANLVPEVNDFINRSAYLAKANKDSLGGKIGVAIIDVPRGGFIEAQEKAHRFFLRSKMIVPGVSAWNTDTGRLHQHKRMSGAETLEEMERTGEMVDWLARAVEPYLESLPRAKEETVGGEEPRFSLEEIRAMLEKDDATLPSLLQDTYFVPPDH